MASRTSKRRTALPIHAVLTSAEGRAFDAYEAIVDSMTRRYALRVKRWRRAMSGCAWQTLYADGSRINWIEAPYPRSPISLSIFLHEVGHHAIGFGEYRLRCEEEYHVWLWAMAKMRELGVSPDEKVETRFELSMRYAVAKATRRGIKSLPQVLERFL